MLHCPKCNHQEPNVWLMRAHLILKHGVSRKEAEMYEEPSFLDDLAKMWDEKVE